MDPSQLLQDKDFWAAPVDQQTKYLSSVDPDFAKAAPKDQQGYITHLQGMTSFGKALNSIPNPVLTNNPILKAPEESGLETGPLLSPSDKKPSPLVDAATMGMADPAVRRTLAREVNTAKNAIVGAPGAIADAYSAPASTPVEKDVLEQGKNFGTVPSKLALMLHRAIVQPVKDAASDYAGGKVSPEAALQVAPEAMGTAAGQVVLSKLLEAAGKGAVKNASAGVRGTARLAETAANQKLLPVKELLHLGTPADEAANLRVRIPGRDFGLPPAAPSVNPGAPFPEPPPNTLNVGGVTSLPSYPGAPLPDAGPNFLTVDGLTKIASNPGAPLPETPPAALLQAQAIGQGGQPAPAIPGAPLATLPVPTQSPVPVRTPVWAGLPQEGTEIPSIFKQATEEGPPLRPKAEESPAASSAKKLEPSPTKLKSGYQSAKEDQAIADSVKRASANESLSEEGAKTLERRIYEDHESAQTPKEQLLEAAGVKVAKPIKYTTTPEKFYAEEALPDILKNAKSGQQGAIDLLERIRKLPANSKVIKGFLNQWDTFRNSPANLTKNLKASLPPKK